MRSVVSLNLIFSYSTRRCAEYKALTKAVLKREESLNSEALFGMCLATGTFPNVSFIGLWLFSSCTLNRKTSQKCFYWRLECICDDDVLLLKILKIRMQECRNADLLLIRVHRYLHFSSPSSGDVYASLSVSACIGLCSCVYVHGCTSLFVFVVCDNLLAWFLDSSKEVKVCWAY